MSPQQMIDWLDSEFGLTPRQRNEAHERLQRVVGVATKVTIDRAVAAARSYLKDSEEWLPDGVASAIRREFAGFPKNPPAHLRKT